MPDGLLTQGGSSISLKQRLQNASGPIVLRPLAVRVRSIWPYSRWVLREAMKSSSLISLLGRPLPQYWRLVRPRYSLMFLPRHGESTIGEFLRLPGIRTSGNRGLLRGAWACSAARHRGLLFLLRQQDHHYRRRRYDRGKRGITFKSKGLAQRRLRFRVFTHGSGP